MKPSSILMSSFAALLMLISVRENALVRNDFESKPEYTVTKDPPLTEMNVAPSSPSVSRDTKDFSYLKFNASEYFETEIDLLPENSDLDYLKFNVNNYIPNTYEEMDLPSAGLDYLKFDVQKYVHNDSVGEINELPEGNNR